MKRAFSALFPFFLTIIMLCFVCSFADRATEYGETLSLFHIGEAKITDIVFSGMAVITSIDVDAEGNILVCINPGPITERQKYIMLLRPDGSLLRTYEFYTDYTFWALFTEEENIVIWEARNSTVAIMDLQGKVLETFPNTDERSPRDFDAKHSFEYGGARYILNFGKSQILVSRDPAAGQTVLFKVKSASLAFFVFWSFSMSLILILFRRLIWKSRSHASFFSDKEKEEERYGCFAKENAECYGCFTGEDPKDYDCFTE